MTTRLGELSVESLGELNYLHAILTQPVGEWDGFYRAQSRAMNFALRYQLAFATYALAAMAQQTPAYRKPYSQAMRGAVERMLEAVAWNYWRAPADDGGTVGSAQHGHLAVLVSPHEKAEAGAPSDPIVRDNLQYSGHLSTMLGLYEKVSGDTRYDHPFTLNDPASGVSFTYTHSEVAGRIHAQMKANTFGGVCCERGMAYVPCNNYALASNSLHDALHGTRFSKDNGRWLRTVRSKMVLKGPAIRGVFGAGYLTAIGMATPVAFRFTDAWGLAFLLPFDMRLARSLYARFKQSGVAVSGATGAFVPSSSVSERVEISDSAINTAFGMIVARGMGDEELADEMERYACMQFGAGWSGTSYYYREAPRTLHSSALYALARTVEPGGQNFVRLFRELGVSPGNRPLLADVTGGGGRVGVSRAGWERDGTLLVRLRQAGDPASLRSAGPVECKLTVENIDQLVQVEVNGSQLEGTQLTQGPGGRVSFAVPVEAQRATECRVSSAP